MAALRIGILGAGRWARTVHIPHLRELPEVTLVAASSNNLEHRQAAREAWGGPLCFYEEPEDVLQDEIDAVLVCTPNQTHERLSVAALQAGKHVFCEKPPALTRPGLAQLAAAVERSGTVFSVGLELRCSDVVTRMRELIREGAVGEPRLLHCLLLRNYGSFGGWRDDPAQSGGLFPELGIHYLDLLTALSGGSPTRVYATGGHALGNRLPDYALCSVDFDNGARAGFGVTFFAAGSPEIRLHVIGAEGRLEGALLAGQVLLQSRAASEPEDRSPLRPPDRKLYGYPGSREVLQDWVRSILSGGTPRADIAVAVESTSLCLAAEESLRSGMPVEARPPG
ncbi:MAG TPA: Gfo/Idh/MocA family oxidoreductase [Armatimonadota bacterium]|nr:Gfo/Idh/MocA family oxidoreductase [Armatimonadota bacterium]